MPRRYNLRSSPPKQRYTDSSDEQSEDSDEEATQPARQKERRGSYHASQSDGSYSHPNDYDSSHLESTGSESFTFHRTHSPSAGLERVKGGNLYPILPKLGTGSPTSKRHGHHNKKSPLASPESVPHGDGPRSAELQQSRKSRKQTMSKALECYSFFGMSMPRLLCALAIVILLIGMVYMKLSDSAPRAPLMQFSHFAAFSSEVDGLKGKFPEQDSLFWKTIKACARHLFDSDEATYPAVLLMVGEKSHAAEAALLARDVGRRFENNLRSNQPPQPQAIASLNLTTSPGRVGAGEQKLILDNWLKEKLNNGHSAVVLNHLEVLSPEAALLLHGYCDGDNAPYKHAMLVLGLYFDRRMDSPQAAESALRNLWLPQLSEDKVGALLSRVANNIVLWASPPPK